MGRTGNSSVLRARFSRRPAGTTPKHPESPYGESKLIGEWLLADQGVAVGLHHTSLRYFNVVGSGSDALYDTSPHNLFPLVFDALLDGRFDESLVRTEGIT